MEIPSITPDHPSKRHDLHPVVRGVASGGLRPEEIDRYGQRVVDHFSERAYSPYDEAETLEDLRDGLYVVRTLLKMGRYRQACDAYKGDLSNALFFNLEARAEVLSLLSTLKQLVATAKVCWTIEHDYLELESELSLGGINPIPGTLQESVHDPGKRHQPAGIQRASAAPKIRLAPWPNGRNRDFSGRYRGSHDVSLGMGQTRVGDRPELPAIGEHRHPLVFWSTEGGHQNRCWDMARKLQCSRRGAPVTIGQSHEGWYAHPLGQRAQLLGDGYRSGVPRPEIMFHQTGELAYAVAHAVFVLNGVRRQVRLDHVRAQTGTHARVEMEGKREPDGGRKQDESVYFPVPQQRVDGQGRAQGKAPRMIFRPASDAMPRPRSTSARHCSAVTSNMFRVSVPCPGSSTVITLKPLRYRNSPRSAM